MCAYSKGSGEGVAFVPVLQDLQAYVALDINNTGLLHCGGIS